MRRVKATGETPVFCRQAPERCRTTSAMHSRRPAGWPVLPDVTFHTLRHTSCSRLAQAGVDILAIAEHAGHRSLSMTRRYSHLSIKGRASMVASVFA